jgi:NDP-sugar pyrophosphorylase family protein
MRLREHSESIPKPMVEIGYRPILWHILKTYSHYGFDDFVICLGHKGDLVIIISYAMLDEAELRALRPKVVFVDERTASGKSRKRSLDLNPPTAGFPATGS